MAVYNAIKYNVNYKGFAGALVPLFSTSFTSATGTVQITSGITSAFDEYLFLFNDIRPATDNRGLVFGGSTPGNTAITEQFDGSSWTEVGDLSTPRYGIGGLAQNPSNAQLAIAGGHGGAEPNYSNQTEEWTAAATIETISFD